MSIAQPPASALLHGRQGRGVLYQVLAVAGVAALGWFLISNTLDNLARQNIATGFGFLAREAAFGIGESLIAYSPADSYLRALTVGLLNTVQVAVIGIVLATLLGTVVGLARLSSNWLVARLATGYVEGIRNVPVLLQLFLWYAVITQAFPGPRQALSPLPHVYLTNRGIRFPLPVADGTHLAVGAALLLAVLACVLLVRRARRHQALTGEARAVWLPCLALLIGLPGAVFAALGAPLEMALPRLGGFNFRGGGNMSPEFAALLIGLTVYTAAFIAEIVRGGILAVSKGQKEAAGAVGLSRTQALRLVIGPQALRVILPPLINQYLNLTKNSSLAVAIGYPDLVSVANTTINQTGQAVEGVAFIMAVYLALSLAISAVMNVYNRRVGLTER